MPKYLHWSTDGITFSPNAKSGGLILIRFGLKHRENDFVENDFVLLQTTFRVILLSKCRFL